MSPARRSVVIALSLASAACSNAKSGVTLASAPASGPASPAVAGQLAFPGAEGFGARARGGRGGDVFHVTSLDDAGPGSLREGIESASGPRTIVFEVSGTIALGSPLLIQGAGLTIAGQTAPGDGVTIRDYGFRLKGARDVVVRFLRLRRGDVQVRAAGRPAKSTGLDTVSIDESSDVIFDRVSASWSCDELFGIVQSKNVTVQWSLLAEPLGDPALHPYGDKHAYGLNTSANTLSVHHNLVANYVTRGPQFEANDARSGQGYDVQMEAVNNVLFDYKQSGSRYKTGIEEGPAAAQGVAFRFHFVNNLYIRDPAHTGAPDISAVLKHGVSDQVKTFVAGNIGPNRPSDELDPWLSVSVDRGANIRSAPQDVQQQMSDQPLFLAPVPITTLSAEQSYDLVLAQAGHSLVRDAVDKRVLAAVSQRLFRDYLRSQNDVGGWPELRIERRGADWDTDRDGMADAWERSHGLSPSDAEDRNGDADGDGFTHLEEYLNELGANGPAR